jgi:hypothetical protein
MACIPSSNTPPVATCMARWHFPPVSGIQVFGDAVLINIWSSAITNCFLASVAFCWPTSSYDPNAGLTNPSVFNMFKVKGPTRENFVPEPKMM